MAANVMLTKKGAKLLDFGIAKLRPIVVSEDAPTATASALTGEGLIVGTPQYMAPEQLEGKPVDARTDIFAFGLLLYEMITGRKAFEAPSWAGVIAAILERDPPPLSPPPLDALVKRCLAKRPADRWQSCAELIAHLGGEGVETMPSRRGRGRVLWMGAGVAGAILAILAAGVVMRIRREPPLTERDVILLGDVNNTTGEAVFDDTLKQALAVQLEQSPYLRLVPDEQVRETLRFMGRSAEDKVVGDVARQICQRRGIKALLAGSIRTLGSGYVADLTATNCQSGDTLVREQIQAATREDVLPAMGDAASRLRRKLGESLPSIERHDAPIQEVTTSSLEALKAFTLAEQQRAKGGDADAIPFYKRAIELDPDFALAYHRVALMYRALGETALDAQYAREAFDRRHRVSEHERLNIEARYHFSVTGQLDKVLETHKVMAETYPRDGRAANNLAVNYGQVGLHEEALKASLEAVRREPDHPIWDPNLGNFYMRLNRFDDAKRQYEKVLGRRNSPASRLGLYQLAFIRGEPQVMQQQREALRGKPGEYQIVLYDARSAAFGGRWRAAASLYERAVDLARRRNLEPAAAIAAEHALFAALFGEERATVQLARRAAGMSPNPHAICGAAVALALSGAKGEAQSLIDQVAREYPSHTLVQAIGLTSARAAIELGRGRPAAAIEQLAGASEYELGDPPWFGPSGVPVYLRGQAFLALGSGTDAAGEFQKIIDRRGLNAVSPIWPLALLGLARAHAAAGDGVRARQAYEALLALWQEADPAVQLIRRAKQDSTRLPTTQARSEVPR